MQRYARALPELQTVCRYVSNLESEEQLVKEAAARSKLLETQKVSP